MKNHKYLISRVLHMNYPQMVHTVKDIHHKTKMSYYAIIQDIYECGIKYGAGYSDYDLFEMYNLNDDERDTYLTRGRNNDLVKKYCDTSLEKDFEYKDAFNRHYAKYLKRDWLDLSIASKDETIAFFTKHHEFMVKPIDGSCGKGIEKINVGDFKDYNDLYAYLTQKDNHYILEELLHQHHLIDKLNPYAINTVRVVTVVTTKTGDSLLEIPKEQRKDVELVSHIICAYFRIGSQKKFVDNFNNDGLVAPIDENIGVIRAAAINKHKELFEVHPETKEPIIGFKLPYWEDVLAMCKEASLILPEMGYCGWDVCIREDGPVLVEGNIFPGHDIYQLPAHTPNKIGMMPKFKFKD